MPVSFDRQADDFDERAGLPDSVARRIAAAVVELAPAGSGALLDLGAGTGQVGEHLAGPWRGRAQSRYLAIDISYPMLSVFREKLGPTGAGALVQADAATTWPIAGGRAGLVFLSRAAHLLPLEVLVDETFRVASPEGALAVFGGVRRDPESLRAVVRREMHRLLAEHGFEGRSSRAFQRRIADALAERGGEVLPARTAASWTVVHRARDSLAGWRSKEGLAGRSVPPEIQERVLGRLEGWIRERYGGLDVEREATDRFELTAIRLPERPGA